MAETNYTINDIRAFQEMHAEDQSRYLQDNPDFLGFLTSRSMTTSSYKPVSELTEEQAAHRRQQGVDQRARAQARKVYNEAFVAAVTERHAKVADTVAAELAEAGIFYPTA